MAVGCEIDVDCFSTSPSWSFPE